MSTSRETNIKASCPNFVGKKSYRIVYLEKKYELFVRGHEHPEKNL